MRTFHIGGTASKIVEQTVLEAKNSGTVKFHNINTVRNRKVPCCYEQKRSIAIADSKGRERIKYSIVYGAKLLVEEGKKVEIGQRIVEWDPYSTPILTESVGRSPLGILLRE